MSSTWKSSWNPYGPAALDPAYTELLAQVVPVVRDAIRTNCPTLPEIDPATLVFQRAVPDGNGRTNVYLYLLPQPDGQQQMVAYKRLASHSLVTTNAMMLAKEAMLLHRLRHPHIVPLVGMVYESAPDVTAGMLCQWLAGGTLRTAILNNMATPSRTLYSNADALRWCIGLTKAVLHLHSQTPTILHRDLNPFNILLSSSVLSEAEAVVVDLGFHKQISADIDPTGTAVPLSATGTSMTQKELEATQHQTTPGPTTTTASASGAVDDGRNADSQAGTSDPSHLIASSPSSFSMPEGNDTAAWKLTSPVGAFLYMAPEVYRAQAYGRPSDIFALGCTFYEIFTGGVRSAMLFPDNATQQQLATYAEQVARGHREPLPPYWPQQLKAVIESCWAPDASKRCTAQQLLDALEALKSLASEMDKEKATRLQQQSSCVIC